MPCHPLKRLPLYLLLVCTAGCSTFADPSVEEGHVEPAVVEPIPFTLAAANTLADLPLACLHQEYPNKLGQVLAGDEDLGGPEALHPAFYGCFDWHSSVHGHWSLVKLLKEFPELERAEEARAALRLTLTPENIAAEVRYFEGAQNTSYERTYGWAWLLKLAEELHTWDDPEARIWEAALKPLTSLIARRFTEFLPKLEYPIRVGEHTNTAFGLSFALDYAQAVSNEQLESAVMERAVDFYLTDSACPIGWEPSGYDFLSPCLEEVDIMRRIFAEEAFHDWLSFFMPQLSEPSFKLPTGVVGDRTDGKLVHLDGLNFSRAWVLYGLAEQYPEHYAHLIPVANTHVEASLEELIGDRYEGGHWLGSFAIYALDSSSPSQH